MATDSFTQLTVAVCSCAGDASTYIRLAGEVDLVVESDLTMAVDRVRALAPRTVLIDLGRVTFACSTLATLLVRLYHAIPDGASLVVCCPTAVVRLLLQVTAVHQIVRVCDDQPAIAHERRCAARPTWSDDRTRVLQHT